MNRLRAAYLLLFLAAGCASSPPEETTASASKQDCHVEYRVGSAIPVKECSAPMSEADRQDLEAARQRAVDEIRNMVRPGVNPPSKDHQ